MSSDNGYVIQETEAGKFVLQEYFASSVRYPDPEKVPENLAFETLDAAVRRYVSIDGSDGYHSEYGLSFSLKPQF